MVRVVPQARDTCVFLLPRWWPRANARLLLTLHHEIGCQTWTRTKTNGLTDRRATLTPPGNGAAGRNSTCIVPFRRRMPHVFGHDSNSENGQRGRICTCGHPVPSRACCCYTTRWSPQCAWGHTGDFVSWGLRDPHLDPVSRGKILKLADPKGVAPLVAVRKHLPADNGLLR